MVQHGLRTGRLARPRWWHQEGGMCPMTTVAVAAPRAPSVCVVAVAAARRLARTGRKQESKRLLHQGCGLCCCRTGLRMEHHAHAPGQCSDGWPSVPYRRTGEQCPRRLHGAVIRRPLAPLANAPPGTCEQPLDWMPPVRLTHRTRLVTVVTVVTVVLLPLHPLAPSAATPCLKLKR